jgi:hypothetical protein
MDYDQKNLIACLKNDAGEYSWKAMSFSGGCNLKILGPLNYLPGSDHYQKLASFTLNAAGDTTIYAYTKVCVGGDAGDAGKILLFVDGVAASEVFLRDSSHGAGCSESTLIARKNLSAGVHSVRVATQNTNQCFQSYLTSGNLTRPVDIFVHVCEQ